jgi:Zn-dependent M28 family amino/carboxypeptidase
VRARTCIAVLLAALVAAPGSSAAVVDGKRAKTFVQRLSANGHRVAGTPNERRGAFLVQQRFEKFGLPVTIQKFRLPNGRNSRNVIAKTGGPVQALVVAHMDSVRAGPGANDNGSGVAAMLEVAHVMRDVGGIWFVAVGAEEREMTGSSLHLGSYRLLRSIPRVVRPQIRLALSLDMVGWGPTLNIRGIEASPNRSARRAIARARALGYGPSYLRDSGVSDHAELSRGGIPAALVTYRWDPCWHSACDVPSRVVPRKLGNAARLTVAAIEKTLD